MRRYCILFRLHQTFVGQKVWQFIKGTRTVSEDLHQINRHQEINTNFQRK